MLQRVPLVRNWSPQVRNEFSKPLADIPWNPDWFIRILVVILVYYNPDISSYKTTNEGFEHCSNELLHGQSHVACFQHPRPRSRSFGPQKDTNGCPGQEVRINGERINGLFHPLINGVYWGYNPFTNLLLTSWDIQVPKTMTTNFACFWCTLFGSKRLDSGCETKKVKIPKQNFSGVQIGSISLREFVFQGFSMCLMCICMNLFEKQPKMPASWWLNQPIWKILVKLDHFPK